MDWKKLEKFLDKFDLDEENFAVFHFFWGSAVKETSTNKWLIAFLSPDSKEVNLEGIPAVVHENGIEFLHREKA